MRKTNFYLVAILIIGLAAAAAADVVIKTKSTMNTMGFMSADVTGTEYVRADRNATESTTKMTGGMMAMMGGDKASIKTASINRLDKGLIWELNAKEMTYSEKPLASLKTDYEEEGEQGQDDMLGEADKYDWTIDVKTEDTPVDISGFKCKGIIATAKGVSKEDPTEKTDLVFEYWYAKDVDGYSELKEYRKNFAAATGLDIVQSQKDAGEIFTRFGDEFKDMFARMEKAEGYPIKTVITVKGSKKMMMQGEEEEDEEMDEENMPAGMAEMMKGMMGGQEESEDGMATLLSITSVVESIMKQPVDDSQYEIPEGYSKEDR